MDVTSIAAMATQLSQAKTAGEVQTAVFKKALDINAQSALQLIEAAAPAARANPPHLGNRIDTLA